jgi:hypothetical protein
MKPTEQSIVLERLIDVYCSAWCEPDSARRAAIIHEIWDEEGTYTDPTAHVVGRDQLNDHIGGVLAHYVGGRVVRTSVIDAHHNVVRFTWKMVLPDGKSLPEGVDFGEVTSEGKVRRIVGFFGPLAQI